MLKSLHCTSLWTSFAMCSQRCEKPVVILLSAHIKPSNYRGNNCGLLTRSQTLWPNAETKVQPISESVMVSLTCSCTNSRLAIGCHGNCLLTVPYRGRHTSSLKFIWHTWGLQPFRCLIEFNGPLRWCSTNSATFT